jgi:MscS family membrane protein
MLSLSIASIFLWFGHYIWLLEIFIVIIAFLLVYKLVSILIKKIQLRFRISHHWVIEVFLKAIRKPLRYFFFLLCLIAIIGIINENTMLFNWLFTKATTKVLLVALFSWCMVSFIQLTQQHILYHSRKIYDKTSVLALGQVGIAVVMVISILTTLQIVGVNLAGILAFGGLSGIAVGFAAKDLLANFFGAIMVYMDKPFKVGDWIRSPEKEIEGEVESIGWRQTKIITFEKRPIYVPNSVFSTIVVENASRMTHRRLNEIVGIRYDDVFKAEKIVDDITELLTEHPRVDNSQSLVVGVKKFSASSVDIMIYCFTTTTTLVEFSKVRQEILLSVVNVIAKHNAEIAFPTSTLHVASVGKITSENLVTLEKKKNV